MTNKKTPNQEVARMRSKILTSSSEKSDNEAVSSFHIKNHYIKVGELEKDSVHSILEYRPDKRQLRQLHD